MKSKFLKRTTALLLCMVMVLSSGFEARADEALEEQIVETVAEEAKSEDTALEEVQPEETVIESDVEETAEEVAEPPLEDPVIELTEVPLPDETAEEVPQEVENEEQETGVVPEKTEVLMEETTTEEELIVEIPEEIATMELTTEVDGTKIILSGLETSFEAGKEYTITATKVENKKDLEVIEEAIDKAAEEKDKVVTNYQAFDIKLFADGVETQPLGPVSVRFSGAEVTESVENEDVQTSVLHVDEITGEAQDMEAVATEENDVAIETTHFSIYVVVDLATIGGDVNVTLEHWATVKTIDGNGTDPFNVYNHDTYKWIAEDNVYNRDTETINWINVNTQIYTTDNIKLPNNIKMNVEDLSKVCLTSANKADNEKNYSIKELWITDEQSNVGKETWTAGTYSVYSMTDTETEIFLRKDSIIRIIYEEKAVASYYWQDADFYDYNVTNGDSWKAADAGINTSDNFPTGSTLPKLGMGQNASGNKSTWTEKDAGAYITVNRTKYHLNRCLMIYDDESTSSTGLELNPYLVKDTLDSNYKLQFSELLQQPGLFETGRKGVYYQDNYDLGFKQTGDTYILSTVKHGANTVLSNLESIVHNDDYPYIFSNEFWPLDDLNYTGMDKRGGKASDDGTTTHNWHFGMKYEFSFTVGDYTGPLNYYFRGDDDFWLFIDGQKVIDLGGIHSAVGEAVDLRAWMEARGMLDDPSQSHRVTIYYTERGGFGSCCYMQFTLPNCKSVDVPEVEKTSLTVNKVWQSDYIPDEIQVELVRTINEIETVLETQTLSADNEWSYSWMGLPVHDVNNGSVRYSYSVREKNVSEDFISAITSTGTNQTGYTYTIKNTQVIDIPVEKDWDDQDNKYGIQSENVQVKLFANGEIVKDTSGNDWILTLDASNDWKGTWTRLPKCTEDNQLITYEVVEVSVPDGYEVSYSVPTDGDQDLKPGDENFKFTVTNTLKVLPLKILKHELNNTSTVLKGAKFQLKSVTYPNVTYEEVTTDRKGYIDLGKLAYGDYTLTEIEAPKGYVLLDYHYHINISDEGVKVARHVDGQAEPTAAQYTTDGITAVEEENVLSFYELKVANAAIYELPSTGGSGIYWYMISGMMLMMAASVLMLYKNRCKEVLRRK